MSYWTYVHGTIVVSPLGRTQPEIRYILDTVLEHLPLVTGSERDMNVYVVEKAGNNSSCSHNEFGECVSYMRKKYDPTKIQTDYILVVDGSLRDRQFEQTYKEFQKWICRLAKRVHVQNVLISIKGYDKCATIQDDEKYYNMFEAPSWSWRESKTINWCEYLMWERMDDCDYPRVLGYKYINDKENNKKVEAWLNIKERK